MSVMTGGLIKDIGDKGEVVNISLFYFGIVAPSDSSPPPLTADS